MQRKATKHPPRDATELRSQIERWRKTRKNRRAPMPELLWTRAAELARVHGVYAMAQYLGVNYENLKRRTATTGTPSPTSPVPSVPAMFLELPPVHATHRAKSAEFVLELRTPQGASLTLRLPSDSDFAPWAQWVDAWWNRRA